MLKLFKKDKKIDWLMEENKRLHGLIQSKDSKINKLSKELELMDQARKKELRYAINTLNFTELEEDDMPKSFLPDEKTHSNEYKVKIGELSLIASNKTFRELITYLVNYKGNYVVRHAQTDAERLAGREFISGVESVMRLIENANKKYIEMMNETVGFDPHEVDLSIND